MKIATKFHVFARLQERILIFPAFRTTTLTQFVKESEVPIPPTHLSLKINAMFML